MILAATHYPYAHADSSTSAPLPVVVLHGLYGSQRNWTSVARRLAEQRDVWTLDLRNHGRSGWADPMTYEAMAADVVETTTDLLGPGVPFALIGHSMGGKTAMLTALGSTELVDRLVLVDIAPVAYPPAFTGYAEAMRVADLTGVTRRGQVDEQLVGGVPEAGVRAFLLQNLILDDDGARWRPNLSAIEAALPAISGWPEVAGSYDRPVLEIAGGRSAHVDGTGSAALHALFPQLRIEVVDRAGHWVHVEAMPEFLDLVGPFLAA